MRAHSPVQIEEELFSGTAASQRDARRALKAYFAERPEVDDPHVFIGQRGNGLTDAAVYDVVKKYARFSSIDELSPHVLRHTFARSLLDKGVDLVTVQ